jgi:formylmethanofuran dehydrogenase subunit C
MPVDGSFARPDVLGLQAPDDVARHPLPLGRESVPLAELFEIAGGPGPRLVVESAPRLDLLGAGMQSGELVIAGDAGDDLGAGMCGGIIRVSGSAGDCVGGPGATRDRGMTGGEIVIAGDAGNYAGLRMRRGLIAVAGACGASPCYRMIAGTVVIGRGPADHPGLEMRRGTIVCLDGCEPVPDPVTWGLDAQVPVGSLTVLRMILVRLKELGLPTRVDMDRGTVRLYSGDRLELGKGELWQVAC